MFYTHTQERERERDKEHLLQGIVLQRDIHTIYVLYISQEFLFRSAAGHADTADNWYHGQHMATAGPGPQVCVFYVCCACLSCCLFWCASVCKFCERAQRGANLQSSKRPITYCTCICLPRCRHTVMFCVFLNMCNSNPCRYVRTVFS